MTTDLTEVSTGDLMAEICSRDEERSLEEALHHIRTWIQQKTRLTFVFNFPNRDEEAQREYAALPENTPGLRDCPFKFILVSFTDGRLTLAPTDDRPPYQDMKALRIPCESLSDNPYSAAQIHFESGGGRYSVTLYPWAQHERHLAMQTQREARELVSVTDAKGDTFTLPFALPVTPDEGNPVTLTYRNGETCIVTTAEELQEELQGLKL